MFFKKKNRPTEQSVGVLPKHIAIIMDGNGRWATKRSLPRTAGHKIGSETFVKTVDACNELGIGYLTVYAFSTENWQRSAEEVDGILKIMHAYIIKYVPELMKKNIRLKILGDMSYFDEESAKALMESERKLENNTGLCLNVALSYGGRHEITAAVNTLLAEGAQSVTEEQLSARLYTGGMPDPDLVIRTGGEKRISNFLLWQSAYAEYYFSDVLWPDFDKNCLLEAIAEFGKRKRRFGK